MITTAQDRKRLIHVTDGNIRNSHVSAAGLRDFLPVDCYGGAKRTNTQAVKPIQIQLAGLNKTIETDIGTDPKTGIPRRHFRARGCHATP
jgi:hypothetical protein